jgi:hypothetical protein
MSSPLSSSTSSFEDDIASQLSLSETSQSSAPDTLSDSKPVGNEYSYPASFPALPVDETPNGPAEYDLQTPDCWVNRVRIVEISSINVP